MVLKKALEYVYLLYIGGVNFLYNVYLFFIELFTFGKCMWWWKLKFFMFFEYLGVSIRRRILKWARLHEYPEENLIYGETPCITVKKMLNVIKPCKGDVFVDLGCGRGGVVFYTHFISGIDAYGYEILPFFVEKANKIKEKMNVERVFFIREDVSSVDVSWASIIYVPWTTFSEDIVENIVCNLKHTKQKTVIITLSFPLPESDFQIFHKERMDFSWGKSNLYFHRRK